MTELEITYIVDPSTLEVYTEGANNHNLYELRIQVDRPEYLEDAEFLLTYTINFQLQNDIKIDPEDSMLFGIWLLQFKSLPGNPRNELYIYEIDPEQPEEYRLGANYSISLWQQQHQLCEEEEVEFTPPRGNQLALVSDGAISGCKPLLGIRDQQADEDLSGWMIFTEEEGLDPEQFQAFPLYEVMTQLPETTPFLAIPHGYWFTIHDKSHYVFQDPDNSSEAKLLH